MKITRKQFLIGSFASFGALAFGRFFNFYNSQKNISGSIVGANSATGHKLRMGDFPNPSKNIEKDIVIIGSGIAGLAAGYQLHKSGQNNFLILDLENQAGGNSTFGKNNISAYPWGAHYVPLLTKEATAVKKLFEELGIITGYDSSGKPVYNEYYICADPQERLYIYGRWQDGLIPNIGLNADEELQYKKFFSYIEQLKNRKGHDGKRLFAIPLDKSSQDREWLDLDKITMAEWMKKEGYNSPHLCWYVNYSCRDDFGTTYYETSAWAGLHYFAARNGVAANTASDNVITWPEGNGWLVNKISEPIKNNIITNALAYNIKDHGNYITVDYFDQKTQSSIRIKAKTAIVATPHFIAAHLIKSKKMQFSANNFSYAPWAVANITLSKLPAGKGAKISWDNVVYNSQMLGYVVATHQITQMEPTKTVITYYWPLSHLSPSEARKEALGRNHQGWQKIILTELLNIHPELEECIENIDIWVWGHAMIRPVRGFIWGDERRKTLQQQPPIFTAHSDMSGISIFEEAYTHGVRAAENVLDYLKISYRSIL